MWWPIVFWHWLIAGVLLIIAEMLAPGAYMVWMGMAALIVAALVYFAPATPLLVQTIVFGVCAIILMISYGKYKKKHPSLPTTLNKRGQQYIGKVFKLEQAIVNGKGKLKVGDSLWLAVGDDAPIGADVKVIAANGTKLVVEKVATGDSN